MSEVAIAKPSEVQKIVQPLFSNIALHHACKQSREGVHGKQKTEWRGDEKQRQDILQLTTDVPAVKRSLMVFPMKRVKPLSTQECPPDKKPSRSIDARCANQAERRSTSTWCRKPSADRGVVVQYAIARVGMLRMNPSSADSQSRLAPILQTHRTSWDRIPILEHSACWIPAYSKLPVTPWKPCIACFQSHFMTRAAL